MTNPVVDNAGQLRDQAINLMTNGGGGVQAKDKAEQILETLKGFEGLVRGGDKSKIQAWIQDVERAVR